MPFMPSPARQALSRFLRLHPAFSLLAGLLAGILPLVSTEAFDGTVAAWRLTIPGVMLLGLGLGLAGAWRQPEPRREMAKLAVGVGLGALTTWLALHPGPRHYHRQLPPGPCGLELEAVVIDVTTVPDGPEWLPNPKLTWVQLARFRLVPDEAWREAVGKLAVKLPLEAPRLGYGDRVFVRGACLMPEAAAFPRDFDFRRYLLTQDSWRVIEASSCEIRGPPTALRFRLGRWMLDWRDGLLARLTAPLQEVKNRQTLAALFFGCRQGTDWRDLQSFQASGTIHIFGISGLHVGVLAATLLWLMCWLPFRLRHLLLPTILLGYVLSTGFQPAAVRALLMIGIWLLQRALLRPATPLNAVFLAAALILVFQPLACLGAGFQFSFTVAGFLVLAYRSGHAWPELANAGGHWLPARLLTQPGLVASGCRRGLWGGLFACLVAWLASLGVGIAQNGYFVPSAPLANLAMLPAVSWLFMVVAAQTLLLPLPFVGPWVGWVTEFLLELTRFIGEHGAGGNRFWLPPHPVALGLFYLALIVLVTTNRRRIFFVATAGLVGIMLGWHWRDVTRPPAILVLHGGGSQVPGIVFCPGGGRPPLIVNAPGGNGGPVLRNLLLAEGIGEVDTLLLPGIRREHVLGAESLLGVNGVRRLLLPATYRAGTQARATVKVAAEAGTRVTLMPVDRSQAMPLRHTETGLDFRAVSGSDWRLSWNLAEVAVKVTCHELMPGRQQLEIQLPGRALVRLDLPRQNHRRIIRLPLVPGSCVFRDPG